MIKVLCTIVLLLSAAASVTIVDNTQYLQGTGKKTYISESEEITDAAERTGEKKIIITIKNQIFTAALEDNQTAKAFSALLPLTIDMKDINRNEKYYVLPKIIRKEMAQNPGTINIGDIMCYGDAGLVLFYDTFSTSYNYVPIGHIDDPEGLIESLGSGDAEVTISAQ